MLRESHYYFFSCCSHLLSNRVSELGRIGSCAILSFTPGEAKLLHFAGTKLPEEVPVLLVTHAHIIIILSKPSHSAYQ